MMLAFLTDLPGIYLLEQHPDWPLAWRAAMALLPFAATALYVRSIARWICGMDELHRRVTLEAFLFSTVTYLLVTAAWFLLNHAGVWGAIGQTTGLHLERMPFLNCTFILCLTYVLFGVGYARINRRYQ